MFVPFVFPYGTARLSLDEFYKTWYLRIFRKYVEKIQNITRIEGNFRIYIYIYIYIYIWQYFAALFLEWEMFQIKVVESIKVGILYSVTLSENRVLYEILWKNVLQLYRPQIITHYSTERMWFACHITKTRYRHAYTHNINIYCFIFT
jgi:hypothetical protein